jgi:tRNA A37 threonylcarbamoyladenosine dehydratase
MVKEKLMEKNDWQQRTELLLGEEKMNRIRKAHVLVVGLGGVGAYAAEMLCRTGVGKMTIVDADTVQPTNMNRQLPAMHSTLGMPKAEVLATGPISIAKPNGLIVFKKAKSSFSAQ